MSIRRPCILSRLSTDRGFTLIELMIVVSISAILAAVASQIFASTLRLNRLDLASGDLRSAVLLARSEAIKRASLVVVEPVSGTDWSSGMRVYVDAAQDPSATYSAGSDTLIRLFSNTRAIVVSGTVPARLAFDGRGQNVSLAATSAARVPITVSLPLCIAPSKRTVQINTTGFVSYTDASC